MSSTSYEYDALAWAEHQAGLLRRLAAGERLNEAIDWANVIEEVQDVGLSELHACGSLLRQAIVHLLKLHLWPESRSIGHWRSEALGFLADAYARFTPSMRRRIDLDEIYQVASRQVRTLEDDSGKPLEAHAACPYDLNDLLATAPDLAALVAKLATSPLLLLPPGERE